MARITIIVLDSFGVGALPDAAAFDDAGANTLGHIREAVGELHIPNLRRLGLYNIEGVGGPAEEAPQGCFGKCAEKADAKDTTNGHFEIAGLIVKTPFRVFGECFPDRIIRRLEAEIGRRVIGNYPASGTEIIQVLGDEHVRTGNPIIYLSADSVMQIAMHEDVIPLEQQYGICRIAREIMQGDDAVARIICRPFIGPVDGKYVRTENRKDYSLDPPGETVLDLISGSGKAVIAVGKIEDIFNRKGITEVEHSKNNQQGIEATLKYLKRDFDGLLFTNLVDFDMLYGHRRNVRGYAEALEYFDTRLPEILALQGPEDVLIITADHGCDPIFKGTDHTREYTPLLVYGPQLRQGVDLGIRSSFADIAATAAEGLGLCFPAGTSFWQKIKYDGTGTEV